jgi:hypothetical protein
MTENLHNLNDALAYLEGKAVHTSQGTFVRMEDVKEAMQTAADARAIERATAPQPKTMAQAKRMVRMDEGLMKEFQSDKVAPPGHSVPAMVPE